MPLTGSSLALPGCHFFSTNTRFSLLMRVKRGGLGAAVNSYDELGLRIIGLLASFRVRLCGVARAAKLQVRHSARA